MGRMSGDIGLGEAITALREQLESAIKEGDGKSLRFTVSPIALTLQAVLSKEGEAGVRWHIVSAGGSAGSERTQTISLTLDPMWQESDGSYTPSGKFKVSSGLDAGTKVGGQ